MGRRAKKAPVVTKKRVKLAKRFKCPFCANEDVVECKMDFKGGIGRLDCRLCAATFQMPIHHLNEPIDVFSVWLDDCEAAQNPRLQNQQQQASAGASRYQEDDEDDDDIPESSGLGAKKKSPSKKKAAPSSSRQETYADVGDSEDDDDE